MMLIFRLFFVLSNSRKRKIDNPLQETTLNMRVWLNDLDISFHMNNGRYLTIMDIGRMDLIARLGFMKTLFVKRWRPLVGGSVFRFNKSLGPLSKYQLVTRLACWDEKWIYLEQRFEKDGIIYGTGLVRTLIRGKNGNVKTKDIMAELNYDKKSPEMSVELKSWLKWLDNE